LTVPFKTVLLFIHTAGMQQLKKKKYKETKSGAERRVSRQTLHLCVHFWNTSFLKQG
jgi:hypothetical protein